MIKQFSEQASVNNGGTIHFNVKQGFLTDEERRQARQNLGLTEGGISYVAGAGIDIDGDIISVDTDLIATKNDVNTIATVTNRLDKTSGKKILAFGDSITEQARWFSKLIELGNFDTIWNRGGSGTLVAGTTTYTMCNRVDMAENNNNNTASHLAGLPSNSNVDIIIFWGGTNDFGNHEKQTAFGETNGEVSKETFCGAYRYIITKLKEKYPGKPIYACSIMTAQGTTYTGWNRFTLGSDGAYTIRQNNISKTMQDYHDAQKTICDLYGVKFIDMFECGISPFDATDAANYFIDGLHPNDAGAEIIANYFYKFIK